MSISITLNFATTEEAQAALAKLSGNAPAAATAPTARTAKEDKAAAPAKKEEPSAKPELQFAEVKDKLMAYSKKVDKDTFGKTMAKFKAKSLKDVEANPDSWADLVAVCDEALG